jgi:hypothetical protein
VTPSSLSPKPLLPLVALLKRLTHNQVRKNESDIKRSCVKTVSDATRFEVLNLEPEKVLQFWHETDRLERFCEL